MILLKSTYGPAESLAKRLALLIGQEVQYIYHSASRYFHGPEQYFLLTTPTVKTTHFIININSKYIYVDHLFDDLNTLVVGVLENEKAERIQLFMGKQSFIQTNDVEPFIISKISLYGEDRIRQWDDGFKLSYFGKAFDLSQEVQDHLTTFKYIVFESKDKRQLVFSADQSYVYFTFASSDFSVIHENDFYMISEIDPGADIKYDEKSGNPIVYSQIASMKLLYIIE